MSRLAWYHAARVHILTMPIHALHDSHDETTYMYGARASGVGHMLSLCYHYVTTKSSARAAKQLSVCVVG